MNEDMKLDSDYPSASEYILAQTVRPPYGLGHAVASAIRDNTVYHIALKIDYAYHTNLINGD